MSAAARRLRMLVLWVGLGLLFGTLLAAVAPRLGGYRSFTVRSGSMTPAIETGDVVVTEPIAPLSARVSNASSITCVSARPKRSAKRSPGLPRRSTS